MGIPPAWVGLVDDAAIFPPGNAPLHDAAAAHVARRGEWWADLVGPLVVKDTDVPLLRGSPARLAVVVTGGAGHVAGAAGLCRRLGLELAGLEIALRDLDDLPGNARRVVAAVDAARSDGTLDEDVPVHIELPQLDPSAGWLAAADAVAEAELALKLRTGGVEAQLFPPAPVVAAWIDAALDRETSFKCTAGLHNAVRHRDEASGFEHHGFVNVLTATGRAFDGAGRDEVTTILDDVDSRSVAARAQQVDLVGARRWFTSFGSCSVTEPLDDLTALGLIKEQA